MNMSPEIGALAGALAKAQGMMKGAEKDRDNPYFKSKYATLSSVIEAIRQPFTANELAFAQPTRIDEHGKVFVTTLIMHSSGQWLSGDVSASPTKQDPQGIGSLISYMKRYGLQAMVGVAAAEDDDDGNAASGKGNGDGGKGNGDKGTPPMPGTQPPKTPFRNVLPSHKVIAETALKKAGFTKLEAMNDCSAWLEREKVTLDDLPKAIERWKEMKLAKPA